MDDLDMEYPATAFMLIEATMRDRVWGRFCLVDQLSSPIKAAALRYLAMTSGVKWKASRKLSVR